MWVGERSALPAAHAQGPQHAGHGALVTPGLIDCHTHLVYGGQRANEFAMRLAGASYEEVARAGGGIVSSVRATRAASEDELFALAAPRLQALLNEGVCAVEIKSGYGLSLEHERAQLRVARRLGEHFGVTVLTTFLGAHALPPESVLQVYWQMEGREPPTAFLLCVCGENFELGAELSAAVQERLPGAIEAVQQAIQQTVAA